MRIKIKNQTTINHIKLMHDGGMKAKEIAAIYNISTATFSNIKRTGWDYVAYKKLVTKQMKSWKLKNEKAKLVEKNKDRATSTLPPEIDKIVQETNGSSHIFTTNDTISKLIVQINELTKTITKLNSFYDGSK